MKIEESKIGFIGQGAIGRRLIDHGFRLSVYDRTVQRMDQPVTFGATAAESASALSVDSDVVMSCVTNDDAVLGTYGSARGAMAAARPGTIVIEMSTVLPGTSIGLSRLRRERAVEVLDVPISGSTPAAEEGTLVLFAGGDRQTFERCYPNLQGAVAATLSHRAERNRQRDETRREHIARIGHAGGRLGRNAR